MTSEKLNIFVKKLLTMLRSLWCLVCMFCISFTGCRSEPDTKTVCSSGRLVAQTTEKLHSENTVENPSEHLSAIDINLEQTKETSASGTSSSPEITENNDKTLEGEPKTATVSKTDVPASAETEIFSPEEILTADDGNILAAKQPPPETEVRLPAIADPCLADVMISVNFDQVDIRMVLKTISDITGANFVVDEGVKGTVTVMSPTKIRLGEVYKVLESILEVKGYAAVPAGDIIKIIPHADAAKNNLQVRIGNNPSEIPKNDSFVTQIIPLKYADAAEVGNIIKPLLTTGSYIATYPRTNSILVTNTSSNICYIAKIIQQLDVAGSKEQVTVIGLTYASAQVLSEQITQIMNKNKVISSQADRSRAVPQVETGIKILPDLRTNSIIIIANAQDAYKIKKLAKELDIQRPVVANNVHVLYLKNAEAKEVAESLTAALANLKVAGAAESPGQVQVTSDMGTNALIIAASAQDYEVIAEIVKKLDIVREQVLVEMLIMEVSEDSLKEIGIDWATLDKAVTGSVRAFGTTNFGPRVDFAHGDLEGLSIGTWKSAGSSVTVGTILTALEKLSGVNILSTPHILTSNHHKAKIIVGENRPFVTQSRITEALDAAASQPTVIKTFEYKDVGISLEITPHISQGGLVRLDVNSEFTKLIEDITSPSTDTPTTAKRQAQTVISMNSGSTVVIGGLIRDDKTTIVKKIPLISDIPLIGGLFKFQKDQLQKTNLLIFITPHVLGSRQDLADITDIKKNEMKLELKNGRKKTNSTDN